MTRMGMKKEINNNSQLPAYYRSIMFVHFRNNIEKVVGTKGQKGPRRYQLQHLSAALHHFL